MNKRRNRKRVYLNDYFEYEDINYSIQQGKQGIYVEIMNRLIEQLLNTIKIHKRVLVYRFDLHINYYEDDNHRLSKFMKRLKTHLQRNYGMNKVGYVWVRELEKSKEQHYHLVLFLDGNKIRHPAKLKNTIQDMWLMNGHMPTIKNPYYYLDKNNLDTELGEVIYRISYLAKVRGKGYRSEQAKDYGASRN
jgi:hypothetical protein